jgi:flagellar hook assembly protein FlgD
MEIYTINGQKIKQLIDSEMPAGKHSVLWNACNDINTLVEPGIYVCRLLVGNKTELSRQMLMVK